MAHIHAVLGPGGDAVPDSVIQDGLKDLLEKGDSLALPWYGPPSLSLEAVYDYVMDHEIPFTMFYTGRKPPAVFETEGEIAESENIQKSLAQMASPGSHLLVLFPDGDEDLSSEIFGFLDFAPESLTIVDLTNGLVPVDVVDEQPEEEKVVEKAEETSEEEDSLAGFTREELEGLGLKLLKRAAANVAPDVTIETKEQAIALILGEDAPVLEDVNTDAVVDVAELRKLVSTLSAQVAKLEALVIVER